MVHNEYSQEQIILTIGVFAAASVRMIPSINKIIVALQNIRYSEKSLNEIYFILSKEEEKIIEDQEVDQIRITE